MLADSAILERLRAGVTTASAEETRTLAATLAAALPPESTLALHGDLGVGKTTFVQGLARGLGISESVTSPTFNIFTLHRGRTNLLHLDAYRIGSAREVEDLLLSDFMIPPWWSGRTRFPPGCPRARFTSTSGSRPTSGTR